MTRKILTGTIVAVLTAVWLQGAASSTAAQTGPAVVQACGKGSWIAGTVDICDGELVYRDYVYDDYGADTSDPTAPSTGILSRPAGDERYPEGQENTADIIDLSLEIDGDQLVTEFEFGALYDPETTVAAVAIDTDADASTGGGAWEGLNVSSEGWDELYRFERGDPTTNLISGRVPLPGGTKWRIQAVAAQKDGRVMNVAFRGTNEETVTGAWWDDKQAAALAGGDISQFGYKIEVSDLRNGTRKVAEVEPGFHQRVYVSKYTLRKGEGMSYDSEFGRHGDSGEVCEQEFNFFGKYQPYGLYVPAQPGPHAMQLALHGCNANHASLVDQPGMQNVMGEQHNRVIVVPLGRGPIGYYSDISERDVLDVMADVEKHYEIDKDKVYSGGYSMGGYGAFRMAMLYPHRFAAMISWVGFTGDCFNGTVRESDRECKSGAIGNVINYVKNLRHVPTAMLYAGADELVHTHSHQAMAAKFRAKAPPYIYYLHPAAEHFTLGLADDWAKEAEWTEPYSLVKNPTRITFRTMRFLWSPKYGIRHDRAYWISEIRPRDGKKWVDLDVASHGCGGTKSAPEEGMTAGPDPVPWEAEYRVVTREPVRPTGLLKAKLRNLDTLRIDTRAACLNGKKIKFRITSDGPARIKMSDGRVLAVRKGKTQGALPAP